MNPTYVDCAIWKPIRSILYLLSVYQAERLGAPNIPAPIVPPTTKVLPKALPGVGLGYSLQSPTLAHKYVFYMLAAAISGHALIIEIPERSGYGPVCELVAARTEPMPPVVIVYSARMVP